MSAAPGLAEVVGCDLFIDLSREPAVDLDAVQRRAVRSGMLIAGRHVTIAAPAYAAGSAPWARLLVDRRAALEAALAAAAERGCALALIHGDWLPNSETLGALLQLHDLDPMVGTIQPRFAASDDDRIVALPAAPGDARSMARAASPLLPLTYLTTELPAALMVLTAQAVGALEPPLPHPFEASLASLLMALRRRGFRNLVANRIVAAFPLATRAAYPASGFLWEGEVAAELSADGNRARSELTAMPERALEALLADAFTADGRPRLLLDCRGMGALHNGTSQAILGYLQGFAQLDLSPFDITALATTEAARFHRLTERFSAFHIRHDQLEGGYAVAVVLNQPWSSDMLFGLHRHAVFIAFNMLDTIAWDILYAAPEGLDEAWRLTSRYADGLLFISEYTQRRFAFRFPPDPSVAQVVTHLSVAEAEANVGPLGAAPFDEPYLLVFGNDYDHKAVAVTLARLADAFPFTRMVALGLAHAPSPRITALRSGSLGHDEIDALVGHAAAIVYPSHYEGFGLPVVQGLARGRTVIVRRSELWEEIAGISRLPGQLVTFDNQIGLVEAVGRALGGVPCDGLPSGRRLAPGMTPPDWRECARRIADAVTALVSTRDARRWIDREVVLRRQRSAA